MSQNTDGDTHVFRALRVLSGVAAHLSAFSLTVYMIFVSQPGATLFSWHPFLMTLAVLFEDAFGEPDGSHSIPGVWGMSYKTFNGVKNCCYIVLSVLCGCPLAFCWALQFACVQCCHIWMVGPCIRAWNMNVNCMKMFYSSCVHCLCDPCWEACALCLSIIRVQNKNG
uniref:Caveolin n=1 Tax=Xenopus tropicalis TaxID=8364 RepID=A0A803K4J0_XENTR